MRYCKQISVTHDTCQIRFITRERPPYHPGYADSDRTELAAMEKHKVWDTVPITSLTSNERQNLCRAHMRYPKFSGETNGERQVEKLNKVQTSVRRAFSVNGTVR